MNSDSSSDWRDRWGPDACRCRHFNGIQNETCKAGHRYEEAARELTEDELERAVDAHESRRGPGVDLDRYAIAQRIPCKRENGVDTCPDYQLPSRETLEKWEAEREEAMKQVAEVRLAIEDDLEEKGLADNSTQVTASIECPACEEGRLKYRRSGHNGHIQAACTTDECVSFME